MVKRIAAAPPTEGGAQERDVKKKIAVPMTPEEMGRLLDDFTNCTLERDELRADRKKVNQKLKDKDSLYTELAEKKKSGAKLVEMDVTEILDYEAKLVHTRIKDSGEMLPDRPMTPEELQLDLTNRASK